MSLHHGYQLAFCRFDAETCKVIKVPLSYEDTARLVLVWWDDGSVDLSSSLRPPEQKYRKYGYH